MSTRTKAGSSCGRGSWGGGFQRIGSSRIGAFRTTAHPAASVFTYWCVPASVERARKSRARRCETAPMSDTKMTKSAGEHWVCSVLSRHGWAAALTRDGLERTDILAVHTSDPARTTIEVQVKSANGSGARATWPLGTKSQQPALSPHEW